MGSPSQLCLVMEQFLLLMLFLFSGVRGEENKLFQSQEKKLIRNLLENYTSRGRPVKDAKQPVQVKLGLTLQQILNIDIEESSMTGIYWVNIEWQDDYLAWSKDEYENVESVKLPANDIWIPDIEVYNMIDTKYLRRQETVVVFDSTGSVMWIPAIQIKSSCFLDRLQEIQTCELKFGSWNHNGLEIDLKLKDDTVDVASLLENQVWEVVKTRAVRNEVIYECCPEPYLDITFNIKLKKKQQEKEANTTVEIL